MSQTKYDHYWIICINKYMSLKQLEITKQLQNLYSWTQFYQEVGNKEQIRKCQTEIAQLKKAYNQTKTKKNG